jgi:hypothetical protein
MIEGRHGYAGVPRASLGGMGGHLWAPHPVNHKKTGGRPEPPI